MLVLLLLPEGHESSAGVWAPCNWPEDGSCDSGVCMGGWVAVCVLN